MEDFESKISEVHTLRLNPEFIFDSETGLFPRAVLYKGALYEFSWQTVDECTYRRPDKDLRPDDEVPRYITVDKKGYLEE